MHKRVKKITSARSEGIFNFRILFQGGKRGLKAKGNVQIKAEGLSISHKSYQSRNLVFLFTILGISKRNSACYRVYSSHAIIFL
jgi:hypothetical protein